MNLEEYVQNLPTSYREYEIQRAIVSNVYLDHLVDTVLNKRHIPPIVLVLEHGGFQQQGNVLQISSFKILDGLQRTYRLRAIRRTLQYALTEMDANEDYRTWSKFKLSRSFSKAMAGIDSNTEVLRAILTAREANPTPIVEAFTKNRQWFEIWTGLGPQEEVRKMLTLNAGHKPVSTRHQLELLFLNLLPTLRKQLGSRFTLVREKEISSTQFSKKREVGSFHFAHIITALLSFHEARPVAPSAELIQNIQNSEDGIDAYGDMTDVDLLSAFIAFLVDLDSLLARTFPDKGVGVLWMGREITLAGLFAALADIALRTKKDRLTVMNEFARRVKATPRALNLYNFEDARNSVDLSQVNIGKINRAAVFGAISELIEEAGASTINWRKHFGLAGNAEA